MRREVIMDLVQLQWIPDKPRTLILQYRCRQPQVDASGAICGFGDWGDWQKVPIAWSTSPTEIDEQKEKEETRILPHTKVEVGGETVLDTTAKRSLVITSVNDKCIIHDPSDDSGIDDLEIIKWGKEVMVERSSTDDGMAFTIEELELLLEVAKKLLQKE